MEGWTDGWVDWLISINRWIVVLFPYLRTTAPTHPPTQVETDAGGKKKVEEVEVMTVKEVQVCGQTMEWSVTRDGRRPAGRGDD